jgi:hypothetical protein
MMTIVFMELLSAQMNRTSLMLVLWDAIDVTIAWKVHNISLDVGQSEYPISSMGQMNEVRMMS